MRALRLLLLIAVASFFAGASAQAEKRTAKPAAARPQASAQIFCNAQGCRPVQKGCRLEIQTTHKNGLSHNEEVCN